jgi:mRNA interferase MazF
VERPVLVPRPAIVLTPRPLGPGGLLIWTAMVTNAARAAWPGDVDIPDAEGLGLLIPSKVRTAKIHTAESASATLLGRLDAKTFERVRQTIRAHLGL